MDENELAKRLDQLERENMEVDGDEDSDADAAADADGDEAETGELDKQAPATGEANKQDANGTNV